MKKTFVTLTSILLVISFALSGCATILKGSSDKVDFSSEPTGAKIYVNGSLMGTTPTTLKLESKKTYTIEFKQPGFETKTITLTNSVGAGYLVLDILFGLVPVIVDAGTGAWFTLDQDHVNGVLEKK